MIEATIETRAEHERVHRDRRLLAEQQHAQQHHGDRGDRVGLEQVRGHAGAVADVVADVVGDHGRVARVVLGNARLDLADKVGADVGGLGEDAAAEPGEDRDQRAAEAEPDQRVDSVPLAVAGDPGEHAVVAGQPDQARPTTSRPVTAPPRNATASAWRDAAARRLRDPCVGAHGHVHADVAGGRRQQSADQKADRDADVLQRDQHDEHDDADAGDRRVLAVQVRAMRPPGPRPRSIASARCPVTAPATRAT